MSYEERSLRYEQAALFWGLDKYGRPAVPQEKFWVDEGGYKGYIYSLENNTIYFNDIPSDNPWYPLTSMAYGK